MHGPIMFLNFTNKTFDFTNKTIFMTTRKDLFD